MANSGQVYDEARAGLTELLRSLSPEQLAIPVPATPGWTIRDVVAHLAGDAASVVAGDFPTEFFQAFGDPDAVAALNRWTEEHVESRSHKTLDEVLEEWDRTARTIVSMMDGEAPWPEGLPFFSDRVLITDIGAHQHDIYGALGIQRDRDSALVRMGIAGYAATIGFRLAGTGIAPLRLISDGSERTTGEGEPGATVRTSRFEMFRALSGRRAPDQIRALEWEGDPELYIPYFYPYGIRRDPLVE